MDIITALQEYDFENVGQFRAIASQFGYTEEYNRGKLLFRKGKDQFKITVGEIKSHIRPAEARKAIQEASKERLCQLLDRKRMKDPEYIRSLSEKQSVDFIRWKGFQETSSAITIIDNHEKTCYTGSALLDYAFHKGYLLDGKGKLEPDLLSGMRQIRGREAKVRYNGRGISVFYKKETLILPDSFLGKKLAEEEKQQLKKGKTILFHGKKEVFLQVDPELNAVVIRTAKELPVPLTIGKTDFYKGYELTPADRSLLANGQPISNKLLANSEGYFIADVSMSMPPDKAGVVFSNIQPISEETALKIKQDLEKGKEKNRSAGMEQLPGNDLLQKEESFRTALQTKDFRKIMALRDTGYKPSESLVEEVKRSGNLTKTQLVAVEKIFNLPTHENTKGKTPLPERSSALKGKRLTAPLAKMINTMFNDL